MHARIQDYMVDDMVVWYVHKDYEHMHACAPYSYTPEEVG